MAPLETSWSLLEVIIDLDLDIDFESIFRDYS